MNPRKQAPLFSAALLIAVTLLLTTLLTNLSDPYECRILQGVHVAGVHIGGMTRAEARTALQQIADDLQQKDLVVQLPEETLVLEANAVKPRLRISKAVRAAYAYGRDGSADENRETAQNALTQEHHVDALAYMHWNKKAITDKLNAYASAYNTTYAESAAHLEGTLPDLSEETFQPDAPGQTLVITLGVPEFTLDVDGLYADILSAYSQGTFLVDWSKAAPQATPASPNLKALHKQYCTEPVDASLDLENKTVIPASYGHCFDTKQAQAAIKKASPGETVRIALDFVEPEKKSEDMYFQDVLGTYTSGHPQLLNYFTNLELVCQFIDGTVLQPGEVFSFNDTVGERTVERGFMYGESFTGLERSKSAGGGVCQGSSILHVCVLEADLEVVERVQHGLPVGYTPLGQDAAVSWGGPDFRFKNNTNFPIKIVAINDKQWTKMQILGTDEKDYYIVLEATQGRSDTQIFANCYKKKFDKETGELISRELAVRSAYYSVES